MPGGQLSRTLGSAAVRSTKYFVRPRRLRIAPSRVTFHLMQSVLRRLAGWLAGTLSPFALVSSPILSFCVEDYIRSSLG